ncbi:hydroxyisourate hydrolase [Bdellovibrio sp. HCB337]|uniref:hydroxyisourate hydrolase n=1 Tax=Bdellovibrio sp. HCB337 TaxID=3394358 RepID=UPI0039A504B6
MISTHILDTSKGFPAESVAVRLQKKEGDTWKEIGKGQTNSDGRFVFDCERVAGTYQITFDIEDYFKKQNQETFFMNTPVIFKITDTQRKYHVPLLLNPFGYSTYRGS